MTPPPFPLDLDHHQDHHHHHHFLTPSLQSSFTYPSFCNPSHGQELCNQQLHQQHQQVDKFDWHGKSYDHTIKELEKKGNGSENQCENSSYDWISTKMSMMSNLTSSDRIMGTKYSIHSMQKQQSSSPLETTDNSSNSSSNNTIRVCSDCNTTKTPLWRSGPKGPQSLCNACGIRQRKARRAAAAAAAAGTVIAADTTSMKKKKMQSKDKRSMNSQLPFKKRCKLIVPAGAGAATAAAASGCERVFPQELKEAAILLMSLSCGLVHS